MLRCVQVCVFIEVHVCFSICVCSSVYLLWDVIYTVLVQEKLYESTRDARGHLFQGVVSQIELHQVLQILKRVLSQTAVTQLRGETYVYSRYA